MIPPCGVPMVVLRIEPSSITPDLRNCQISFRSFLSFMRRFRNRCMSLWSTASKHDALSPAMTHTYPVCGKRRCHRLDMARCVLLPGLKPYESWLKSGSKIGSSIIRTASCTIRSSRCGIPSGRSFMRPAGLTCCMYLRRTGEGLNVPCCNFSLSRARIPCSLCSKLLLVTRSTPAVRLPLFAFTFSQALASQSSRQRRLYTQN
jgi:hypothetical protein